MSFEVIGCLAILLFITMVLVVCLIEKIKNKIKSKNPCKNCRVRKRVCIGCPVALRKEYYHGRNRNHE